MTTQSYAFTTTDEPGYLYNDAKVAIGPTYAGLINTIDPALMLLVHGNGNQIDSSSHSRVPTEGLAGGTITYPVSAPPILGLGSNYIQVQGIGILATPIFYYPASADFLFDGQSGSVWELSFRYKCPSDDAGGRTYRIASFGSSTNTNFSSSTNKLKFYINSTVPPMFIIDWNATFQSTFDLSTTNYDALNLNHIAISNDGSTIKLFVNGTVHTTTYPVSSNYNSFTTATPIALFTGGDSGGEAKITAIDEIRLQVGGTVHNASFVAPTAEYLAGSGYAQDNQAIEPVSTFSQTKINSFAANNVAYASDSVTYAVQIGNIVYWWNGSAWYPSNGYPETNTAGQVNQNLSSLSVSGNAKILAFLHSSDGTTSPNLYSITVDYDALVVSTEIQVKTSSEFQEFYGRRARVPVRKRTFLLHGKGGDRGKWYKCWNCGFRGNRVDRNLVIDDVEAKLKHSIPAVTAGTTNQPVQPYGNYVNPMRNSVTITGKTNLSPVGFQDVHSVLAESAGGCAFCGSLNYR